MPIEPWADGAAALAGQSGSATALMLHILTYFIPPVLLMLALGFLMGRTGKASDGETRAITRSAFLEL